MAMVNMDCQVSKKGLFFKLGKNQHTERKLLSIEIVLTIVSVQGFKSLGGHFACLCRGFEFYEVKKKILLLFFKNKIKILLHFLSFA